MQKFKINSKELIDVLEPLQAVINPSHIVPILQCVNIEATKKKLLVVGDNHEVRCLNGAKFSGGEKFNICTNFQMLLSALKSIKAQDVEIEISTNSITIYHSHGDFQLPLEDSSVFPKDKKEDLKSSAKVNSQQFKATLKVANKFVLNDDLESMSNISIEIGKKTTIRSTDRFSLFQETIKGGGDKANILISGKSSTSIQQLLDDKEDLELSYNENLLFFKFGLMEVMIVQQQGSFPIEMFNKIIETVDDSIAMNVDYDDFISSLKRVTALSSKEKVFSMKLTVNEKTLGMSCDNIASSSRAQENLNCDFTGEAVIGFNPKLMIEILSVFDKSAVLSINKQNAFCIKHKKRWGLLAPRLLEK